VQSNFLDATQHYYNELDIRHLAITRAETDGLALPTTVDAFKAFISSHQEKTSTYLKTEYLTAVIGTIIILIFICNTRYRL
jgi:hypothetical protein